MQIYQLDVNAVAQQLNTDLANGLDVENNAVKIGFFHNALQSLRGVIKLHRSKFYYVDVIALVCYAIALIFFGLNQSWDLLVKTVFAICLTCLLYFTEGYFIYRYREAFYNRVSDGKQKVTVIRSGARCEILQRDLVVGDLVCLAEGVVLYADARIVSADGLFADEKLVFGTTIPSDKTDHPLGDHNIPPEKQKNMLWKGSYITGGSGMAIVTAVKEDCYIEKTGGRKKKKQRSFFYNKQNNIGHIASYVYVIIVALVLLFSVIFTNQYVESFLMMAVMTSIILLNPVTCLMEWTYYRTALKLYKQGALIRNIEAFDGMNKEKELYFDVQDLLKNSLTFSHTMDFAGSEKSTLSYFSLCVGSDSVLNSVKNGLERHGLSYEQLSQNYPVYRREEDRAGNIYSAFSNNGTSVVMTVGYWNKMLPLVKKIDDELLSKIRELELHGKMVYLLADKKVDFIPAKLDFDLFAGQMNITALVIFNISVINDTFTMVGQLRHSEMQVYLISDYSDALNKAIASSYDMDGVLSAPPQKPCYTLPHFKEQNLVVMDTASPIEKEQATVVITPSIAPQQLVYLVKCMFCGIRRCLNFLSIVFAFLVLTIMVMFLNDFRIEQMIFPALLLTPVFLCPCYYFIESVRNCNQYHRSLILGVFCGVVSFVAALIGCEMALFSLGLSAWLLSFYFLVFGIKQRKIKRSDLILLGCVFVTLIAPWLFMAGNWMPAVLLACFPPLGAFLLDLFY